MVDDFLRVVRVRSDELVLRVVKAWVVDYFFESYELS